MNLHLVIACNGIFHDSNLGFFDEINDEITVFRLRQIILNVLDRLRNIHTYAVNHAINVLNGIDSFL